MTCRGSRCCDFWVWANIFLVAISDNNLMNTLLAYSAFHRPALLGHFAPEKRIHLYVREAISDLGKSIASPVSQNRVAKLAVITMLASMGQMFVSPADSSMLSSPPWQSHLRAAKGLIKLNWSEISSSSAEALSFLREWFFHLELFRKSPGLDTDSPLIFDEYGRTSWRSPYPIPSDPYDFHIECLWGTTLRCLLRLTKIAELVKETNNERSDFFDSSSLGWAPPTKIRDEAMVLKAELELGAGHLVPRCHCTKLARNGWGPREMRAVNRLYHLAGLIHLNRRILGRPSSHPDVQSNVTQILETLKTAYSREDKVQFALLFPIITAGCEAQRPEDKQLVLERCKSIELLGLINVRNNLAVYSLNLLTRRYFTGLQCTRIDAKCLGYWSVSMANAKSHAMMICFLTELIDHYFP